MKNRLTFNEVVKQLENMETIPKRIPHLLTMINGLDLLGLNENVIYKKMSGDLSKIIIVAGTNGKGSVCSTLETLLLSAGRSVGFYSSPHLIDYCERIRIDGQQISKDFFLKSFERICKLPIDPSHFEILTLMACFIFFSEEIHPCVDYAIFEVGMGGTWDATNAIPHGTCIITPISFDHQSHLGYELTEIAKNKFGIVTPPSSLIPNGVHVIHSPLNPDLMELKNQIQRETQSHWIESLKGTFNVSSSHKIPTYELNSPWGDQKINLPGRRGIENTLLALTAFQYLGFDPSCYLSSLEKVKWPGRMEYFYYQGRHLYLSGDHNPHGALSLIEMLTHFKRRKLFLLVGISHRKDYEEILKILSEISNSEIYLTEFTFGSRKIEEYGLWKSTVNGTFKSPHLALPAILEKSTQEDLIIVTGSLYLVGEIRKIILE